VIETQALAPSLRSLPKRHGSGVHRTVSPQTTWQRIERAAARAGVTRVADITGLDHLGVPVYSCIRPSAVAASVSVTCGKGTTRAQAMVGAAMEAIEYHCAESSPTPLWRAAFAACGGAEPMLDPADLILPDWTPYRPDRPIDWMRGWSLTTGEPCWIPANAVLHPYAGSADALMILRGSTNGLASGNELEEAICHALAELIERDAWSLCWVRVRFGRGHEVPGIDLATATGEVGWLRDRVHAGGVDLHVRDITSDTGVPAYYAATLERTGAHLLAHEGMGAHPDPSVALARALTEAVQSRAADIQGSREDLDYWRRRAGTWDGESDVWGLTRATNVRSTAADVGARHTDIRDDIRWMLSRLAAVGLPRAFVVDLSRPEIGVPVVRVIVPGLEFTAIDEYRAGARSRRTALATQACRPDSGSAADAMNTLESVGRRSGMARPLDAASGSRA
jgi:ribosomal protein S12 methylthiotransferase accessory factor